MDVVETFAVSVFQKGRTDLYRTAAGRYYGLVKKGGKQFRRSLKTSDHAFARRRLREFQEKASRLSGDSECRSMRFEELAERWLASRKPEPKESSYVRRVTSSNCPELLPSTTLAHLEGGRHVHHMIRPTHVEALTGYRLRLEYADGTQGEIDLSADVGHGVFAPLADEKFFRTVHVGRYGQIAWTEDIEICPDAAYLRLPAELRPKRHMPEVSVSMASVSDSTTAIIHRRTSTQFTESTKR